MVGVEYERNTACAWCIIAKVPHSSLHKCADREQCWKTFYGIDFNPYQPVFKFNQFVHVIERSRKKIPCLAAL